MKKRPIVIVCFLTVIFILFLSFLDEDLLYGTALSVRVRSVLENSEEVCLCGRISERRETDQGEAYLLENVILLTGNSGEDKEEIPGVRLYLTEARSLPIGSDLLLKGALKQIKAAENPGQFDAAAYYKRRGILFSVTDPVIEEERIAKDSFSEWCLRLRESLKKRIEEVYPEDAEGIFSALLIGDRTLLDDETGDLWQRSGISHMLAISGLHLSLIGMALFSLLRRLGAGLKTSSGAAAAFLFLYACLTGFSISTLRAFLMFLYMTGAKVTGRSHDPANALALSALLILWAEPGSLFESGFLMSYTAVTTCYIYRKKSRIFLAFVLYFTSLPLVLWSYYELPFFSVFLNLFLVPLLPALLVCGLVGMALGGVAALPGVWLLKFFRFVMESLEGRFALGMIMGRPALIRILIYYGLLFLILALMERFRHEKKRFLLMAVLPVLILLFRHFPDGLLHLTALSVGQGDCLVLRTPEGQTLLIDGGSSSLENVGTNRILPYLKEEGIDRIDQLVLTHADTDHMNGILELLEAVSGKKTSLRIESILLPLRDKANTGFAEIWSYAELLDIPVREISEGDAFRMGEVYVEVMNPDGEDLPQEENEASLVLAVSYGSFDALLTGDMTGKGEENVVQVLEKEDRDMEVMKVAHHGSKYSTYEQLLEAAGAETAVISVGTYSLYGHPHAELLERLEAYDMAVYITGETGALSVTSDGEGYGVTAFMKDEMA